MGIKRTQSAISLTKFIAKSQTIIRDEIKRTLSRLGEECNKRIRDRAAEDSWNDQTGNLRSSIGYAIYSFGKVEIESAFNVVKDGVKGHSTGKEMVEELASLYADTYALVVLAGMEYASKVEDIETKDVLASTELWAKGVIKERLEKAKDKATTKINNLII